MQGAMLFVSWHRCQSWPACCKSNGVFWRQCTGSCFPRPHASRSVLYALLTHVHRAIQCKQWSLTPCCRHQQSINRTLFSEGSTYFARHLHCQLTIKHLQNQWPTDRLTAPVLRCTPSVLHVALFSHCISDKVHLWRVPRMLCKLICTHTNFSTETDCGDLQAWCRAKDWTKWGVYCQQLLSELKARSGPYKGLNQVPSSWDSV